MASQAEIQTFVDEVVEQFAPQRVILFGSHARGDTTPDSDVDLLVVMPTKKRTVQQALEIRLGVSCPFPLDLIVRTPEDVQQRLALRDCFLQTIMTEGKILYESSRRRVGRKSGRRLFLRAKRELRARKNPNYDSACFHAQQCAEKYLKAVLQSWEVAFPKTHDLAKLLDLCLSRHPEWEAFKADFQLLTQFSVIFRYPGESATKEEASHAVKLAATVRTTLLPPLQRKGLLP